MSKFVIRTDGKTGELVVDGKRVELFGELVGVDVRRDITRPSDPLLSPMPGLPVVEVTLRLPLKPTDTLTLLRDTQIEDVPGPTADVEGA